jgi:universal stress protein E
VARLLLTYTDFKLIETCPCPLLLLKTERTYLDACVVAAVDPMHTHDKPAALDAAIVDAAALLTGAVEGRLHICHALTPWADLSVAMPVAERTYAELCATYRERAQSRVMELAPRAGLRDDRIHVVWGEPSETLPRFAHSLNADVMVMGAVSRSGLERVFIGYTAERVLDALECDVLVVKPPGFRVSL